MNKPIIFILFFTGLLLTSVSVVLFSWLPDPLLSKLGWLPKGLGQWADHPDNINFRTAVPMFVWGLLAGLILLYKPAKRRWWILVTLLGIALVCLAELGQFLIPDRHPDLGDVGWGTLGLAAGLFSTYTIGFFMNNLKSVSFMER